MNNKYKVKFDFCHGDINGENTYFEGKATYFFHNDILIYETVEVSKIIFRPRKKRNDSGTSQAIELIKKKDAILQLRFLEMKKNEIWTKKNSSFYIEIDNNIHSPNFNLTLISFNNALIKNLATINSLSLYLCGSNPSGHNKRKNSEYRIINSKNFNGCQFIQFFTYILGNIKRKQNIPLDDEFKDVYEYNFDDFFFKKLDEYFKISFCLTNNLDKYNKNLLSSFQVEAIKNEWTWKTINEEIRKYLKLNIENANSNKYKTKLLNTYIASKRREYVDNVNKLIQTLHLKYDSIYKKYLINSSFVEKCHIWEVKQIKKEYLANNDIKLLDYISDKDNVLFLTSTIHNMWDKKSIKLLKDGFFINENLTNEEWKHIEIENINILSHNSVIKDKQIWFINKRNS